MSKLKIFSLFIFEVLVVICNTFDTFPTLSSHYKYSSTPALQESKGLCYVSSVLNTSVDGFFTYPLDLFNVNDNTNIRATISRPSFPCSSNRSDSRNHHICSWATNICPLKVEMVAAALSRNNKWLNGSPSALRNLRAHLLKAKVPSKTVPFKVIILGGSLTYGADAEGCFSHSWAAKCGWSLYLTLWLHSIGRKDIEVYNLAVGGATSEHMSAILSKRLDVAGLKSFSSNDIVLVDHSVNDAIRLLRAEEDVVNYRTSLERLIHVFFSRGDEKGLLPLIVFLEIWPYANGTSRGLPESFHSSRLSSLDYSQHQAAVARHYNLPSLSYKDVVWQSYDGQNQEMTDYIRFLNNKKPHHPPWFVHLFIADVLAASLVEVAQKCDHGPVIEYSRSNLPKPLHAIFQSENCDESLPLLIDGYAHDASPTGSLKAGSVSAHPPNSWQLLEDSPTKLGWIVSNSLSDSGRDKDRNHDAILRFQVSESALNQIKPRKEIKLLLQISYLRTFEKAGIAEVFLDDRLVGIVDGLYPDFLRFKFSINEPFTTVLDAQQLPRVLEFRWKYLLRNSSTVCDAVADSKLPPSPCQILQARGTKQKVKIVSVLLCVKAGRESATNSSA